MAAMPPQAPLHPRHPRFVEGVLAGKPATQAYSDVDAGLGSGAEATDQLGVAATLLS